MSFRSYVLVGLTGLLTLSAFAAGADRPALALLDLAGRPVDPFDDGARASVFVFVRSDCPISNRYAPELRRLYERFSPERIAFWLVYPDPAETPELIRTHIEEYAYPFTPLRDPRQTLVRATGAEITPEAAVFSNGEMVYRGRIDDLYVSFGKRRAAPTTRDLAQALKAIVDGTAIAEPRTQAVGCFIPALDPASR